jgi:hypothetical protein
MRRAIEFLFGAFATRIVVLSIRSNLLRTQLAPTSRELKTEEPESTTLQS